MYREHTGPVLLSARPLVCGNQKPSASADGVKDAFSGLGRG